MLRERGHSSSKYTTTEKTQKSQSSYKIKKESKHPTYTRRNIKTESILNNIHSRTDSSRKYYPRNNREENANISSMNNKRKNKASDVSNITTNRNNYGVINRKKNTDISLKVYNSNYEGINKWRLGKQAQISNNSQHPNARGQIKLKYQSNTTQNQPTQIQSKYVSNYKSNISAYTKRDDNNKNNLRQNVYFSGSSQSNDISTKRHNTTDYSKKSKINIVANRTNLINKNVKKYSSPGLRIKDTSSSSLTNNNTSRNNTVSHTIINIKKTSQKPVVLHVRKTDIIRYHVGNKGKYSTDLNKDNKPLISNENHSIKVTRNVTKELKTVLDVPDSGKPRHRYNYKSDPNLSNIRSHSIDATKKNLKKKL